MPERHERGLLDTSVLIDLHGLNPADLPSTSAVAAISLAELSAETVTATSATQRAQRQARVQTVEATFDVLPFDAAAARAYARVYASVAGRGREARGRRAVDLLIAATALAHNLALYTRNPADFTGIADLTVVGIR